MCEKKECKPHKLIKMLRLREKPPITDECKIWRDILNQDIDMKKLYDTEKEKKYKKRFARPEMISNYLESDIYSFLIPAFEYACALALAKNAPKKPKQIFNAVDAISEYLWNKNSSYPERSDGWKSAYSIFKSKLFIKERPVYPLHWIISKETAALMIQRFWRGYKIRKLPAVQELRNFWKQIKLEDWKFRRFIPRGELTCPPRLPREERLF